jgi:hypothetical protein
LISTALIRLGIFDARRGRGIARSSRTTALTSLASKRAVVVCKNEEKSSSILASTASHSSKLAPRAAA